MTAPISIDPTREYFKTQLASPSGVKRLVNNTLWVAESPRGFAHTKFAQTLLTGYLPKFLLSRSAVEAKETSFIEISESLFYHYGIAVMGQYLFRPLFKLVSPFKKEATNKLLSTPVSELLKTGSAATIAKLLPIKAAVIVASLGISAVGGEYALHFVKNLITERFYKKSHFSDVVGLSKGQQATHDLSPSGQKARRRIWQCLGVSAAFLGFSTALARFGGRLSVPALKKFVSVMDFEYTAHGGYSLSRNLMRAYMAIGFVGYLDAARDKLEMVEIASRVGMVLAFLNFGHEWIQKGLVKMLGKNTPGLLKDASTMHSVGDLVKMAQASGDKARFFKQMSAKSALFFIPMAIAIAVPGLGVGLLNRFWTAYRFRVGQDRPHPPALSGIMSEPEAAHVQNAKRPAMVMHAAIAPTAGSAGQPFYAPSGFYGPRAPMPTGHPVPMADYSRHP